MSTDLKISNKIINCYKNKEFIKVLEFSDLILKDYSEDIELLNILLNSAIQEKNFLHAVNVCEQIINIAPEQPNINLNLGNLYRLIGNYDKAIRHLEIESNYNSNNFPIFYNLALAYDANNDLDNAEKNYKIALDLIPVENKAIFEEVVENYLKCIMNMGKNKDAFIIAKELILKHPESEILLGLLGNFYGQFDENDKSIECYEKALRINNENKKIKYDLSFGLKKVGRIEDAIKILENLNYLGSRAFYIENLFLTGRKEEFLDNLDKACMDFKGNRLLANLSKYVSYLYKREDKYPFCSDPFNFIYRKKVLDVDFINHLNEEILSLNLGKMQQPLIRFGEQSAGNLFKFNSKNISLLKDIVEQEIISYKKNFKKENQYFLEYWPDKTMIYAWFINLKKGGELGFHYHHKGWISGSVYLKVPYTSELKEGSIEFGYNNRNYKENINAETKVIKPEVGDIILFPSSLSHRVNPFKGNKDDENRISIAFDIMPVD